MNIPSTEYDICLETTALLLGKKNNIFFNIWTTHEFTIMFPQFMSVIVRNLSSFSSIQTAWIKLGLPEIILCCGVYRSVASQVMVGYLRAVKGMGVHFWMHWMRKKDNIEVVVVSMNCFTLRRGWVEDTWWKTHRIHAGKEWGRESCIQTQISTSSPVVCIFSYHRFNQLKCMFRYTQC